MNKQEAWKYYKTWMHERTYCKALKTDVRITLKGWDHLNRGSSNRRRKSKDKYNKFQLLKEAKIIIKTSQHVEKTKKLNEIYYELKSISRNKQLKVLLKKDRNGNYFFYSVMKH